MPKLRSRGGALVLAFAAILLSLALLSGVSADTPDVGTLHVSDQMETVVVPPAVLAVMDRHVIEAADAPAAPAQAPELITLEGFEDEVWPPADWEVVSLDANEDPVDDYTWGRVTCESYESDASAWSIGGGTEGINKTCWTPYDNYIDTFLLYPAIDTTSYEGGIRVQLRLMRNIPEDDAFKVCVRKAGEPTAGCFSTQIGSDPGQETGWLQLNEPWVFENTGGLVDLTFFLRYLDEGPDGSKKGVLVDDVLLEGLPQQAPPTDEPTPGPGTPMPDTGNIYLPLTMKNASIDDLEPIKTPEPSSVKGEFGLGLDTATGELLAPGDRFEYGQMRLCFKMTWTDLSVGTPMRYQWNVDDIPIGEGDTDLNPVFSADAASGWAGNCVQANNPDTGEQIPIPLGTFRVDMYVEDITPDAAPVDSASAIVQEDTPEGATPLPTAEPTLDPGEFECNDVLINGDFEQGPNIGWVLNSNAVDQDENPIGIDQVILQNDQAAFQGEWFAFLGRGENIWMELSQSAELELFAAGDIERATLTYRVGMLTKEIAGDGEHNDEFASFFISQKTDPEADLPDNVEIVPGSAFSEETVEHGQWLPWSLDVKDLLTKREGWDTARLLFLSKQNEQLVTQHFLDVAVLEVCTRVTSPAPAADDVTRLQGRVRPFTPFVGESLGSTFEASDAIGSMVIPAGATEFSLVQPTR